MRTAALALVLLAAAGSAWAVGAPEPPSCTDGGDRLTKLTLVERLTRSPQLLVLGSSRARVAMPDFVEQLTGLTTFNAGVRGGAAADEYVFARLLAQRFPERKRAYLVFVDVGIADDGVNPELADEPLARPFLGRHATARATTCRVNDVYDGDGGIAGSPGLTKAEREARTAATVAQALQSIAHAPERPMRIDPARTRYFRRLLGFINAEGATPVIVLNPIYPTVLAALRRYGFPKQRASDAYLAWLHRRDRFVVVDCEDIRTWGGRASDFLNFDHVDRANMRRMLRYVVAHSGGLLRG